MARIAERREYRRAAGSNLVAWVDDEAVEVMDISAAGLRLARPVNWVPHRNLELQLIPRRGRFLDIDRAIRVLGHVVGDGPDHLRIAFSSITGALANIIDGCSGTLSPSSRTWRGCGRTSWPAIDNERIEA